MKATCQNSARNVQELSKSIDMHLLWLFSSPLYCIDFTIVFLCCFFRSSFKFWLFLLETTTSLTYWQFPCCCQFLMMSIWSQFYHLGLVRRLENLFSGLLLFFLCWFIQFSSTVKRSAIHKPTQKSKIAKALGRIASSFTIAVLSYWTVKLFALELSSKSTLKAKISK